MKRRNRMKLGFRRAVGRASVLAPLTFLLVAGAGCPSLFKGSTSAPPRAAKSKQAVPGKDAILTVSDPGTVVNVYARLAGTTDPVAGDTTITVSDVNDNFLDLVEEGDLLLIIQMAGATADFATNDGPDYGAVTNLGSAGRYELVGVEGVAGSVITLACGLQNGYARNGKAQVVRVPQYTSVTVNAGASIVAPAWDGATGGIVAVHAQGTVTLTGTGAIDASDRGFRGGEPDNASATAGTAVVAYRSTADTQGAEKGEGIAGDQTQYANGEFGRGAPANAGGGGNAHNAGGGGGANAAAGATWTGQGVMTGCTGGATDPWRLDPAFTAANPDACSNSEGGGRGGYSFSNQNEDPVSLEPGETDWGGNSRREAGGLGGRPVPNAVGGASARLFMGGGGGAGDGNNGKAGRGGNGGGLVFLIAGQVAGDGTILANGQAGGTATFTTGGNDAAGGGGGGGTVVVNATSIAGTVKIRANGGAGGDHSGGTTYEVEGPGGGGGGGFVAVSGGTPDVTAAGGLAGTSNQTVMEDFPANGATAGHAGVTNASAADYLYCAGTTSTFVTTIATHPDAITNVTTGTFTFTNPVSPVTYDCQLDGGDWGDCSAAAGHTTDALADGEHTLAVRATDGSANVEDPPVEFTWTIDTQRPNTTISEKPAAISGDPTAEFTFASTETPPAFECRLDGVAAWTACEATYTTATLADGEHTLEVRAKDAAGNVDDTPEAYEWEINTGIPVTTIADHPAAASNQPVGVFTFTNTRTPVTYECKLDDGDWEDCGASYSTPSLADGEHTLSVRSTASSLDGGVFLEDPPKTFTWTIDTLPPDTSITDNPPGRSTSPTAAFVFASSESPVTYECKIDDGDWSACTAAFTTEPLPNGTHTLSVRSRDAAGNVDATPATSTWEIAAMVLDGGVPPIDGGQTDGSIGPVIDGGVPPIDGGIDGGGIDGAGGIDGQVLDTAGADARDGAADAAAETRPPGPEPGRDAAVVTEPGRDAATGTPDAPVGKADAPVDPESPDYKILGGGFCAIAPAGSASPAAFLLLGLAGLALLLRRRR